MWTAGSSLAGLPAVFSNHYFQIIIQILFSYSFSYSFSNPAVKSFFRYFFKSIYKYLTLPPYGFRLKSVVQSDDVL